MDNTPKAATIDEYLAGVRPEAHRRALERLRAIILDEAPDAVECISYGMPTWKFNRSAVHCASFTRHCSFFPGGIVPDFAARLAGWKIARGTVQFTPENPLPEELVRDMVRARFNLR